MNLKKIGIDVKPQMALDIFDMARFFHKIYEEESVLVGWKTQESCQVDFDNLPHANKVVMLRTCAKMVNWLDSLNLKGVKKK